jgi:single-strand DNA-binding protein
MSYNYNQATLVGRLTKDPEFYSFGNDREKLSFTIAINRFYRKMKEEKTDFIPISLYGPSVTIGTRLLKKGVPVLVWGRIQVQTYEKGDEKRWKTEIVAENFQLLERFPDTYEKEKPSLAAHSKSHIAGKN